MNLEIIATGRSQIFENIEWIEVDSQTSNFVILPGHCPVISLISAGKQVSFKKNGSEKSESVTVFEAGVFSFEQDLAKLIF